MENKKPSADELREIILNLKEPIIFKNIEIHKNNEKNVNFFHFESFKNLLKNMELSFRVGKNARTPEPQWDVDCQTEIMTFPEFVEKSEKNQDHWYYFDYKYMHELFKNKPEILNSINWKEFGFDKDGEDSTLWIGSKGAHTNCHQDSYGCNLIAQLHGRKQWILFPPDSNEILQQTRIPYEESTIYSKINFFSPSKIEEEYLKKIDKNCMKIILEPGDILFVPKSWWHFVESLDLSVSVNVWLPLDSDCEARLKEAIVKLIMTRIGDGISAAEEAPWNLQELMKLIEKCMENYEKWKGEFCEKSNKKRMKKSLLTIDELTRDYPNFIKKINYLDKKEFNLFLNNQRQRFPEIDTKYGNSDQSVLKIVADSFCHSDVINKILEKLLN